jgi:pyruvate/2-oxoglutarate/acetoin dehydrogenase E1 component
MTQVTFLEGIRQAQHEEMSRDPTVFLMGQDLRLNFFGTARDFVDEFGPERVRDAPLSEAGFVGAAVGAALTGCRPIVDMTICSFLYCAMDQIVSQAAKNRYMFGGQARIPLVVRAIMFYAPHMAAHHSDRSYPMFMNVPGLKIIAPTTPADVKGMLKTAIRDDDPVLCFEDQSLWNVRGEIPDGDHLVPLGVAAVRRPGTHVTIVAIAGAVRLALSAADALTAEGVDAEVIDVRSLVPLDRTTILESVGRTGRAVIVDPAHRTCSAASEIAAVIAEDGFDALRAPVVRVTTPDVHMPFSPVLHAELVPTPARIVAAVHKVLGESSRV